MFLSGGHGIHREKITAVASALFTEKGIAATTVDEIAKKAGYSKATFDIWFVSNISGSFCLLVASILALFHLFLQPSIPLKRVRLLPAYAILHSPPLYNLKDAANMPNFLTANGIGDMAGPHEKFKSMIGERLDIQGKLKPVERRMNTLKKHIGQADIYFKYKGKKPLTETEQIRKSVYSILRQEQREHAPAERRMWSDNGQGGEDT